MPGMGARVAKLGHALLARLTHQPGFIKALADRGCGFGDEREVGEADLTQAERGSAFAKTIQLLAHAHAIGCSSSR